MSKLSSISANSAALAGKKRRVARFAKNGKTIFTGATGILQVWDSYLLPDTAATPFYKGAHLITGARAAPVLAANKCNSN